MCPEAQSIVSDRDTGISEDLFGMILAPTLSVVLFPGLVLTLVICGGHCHQALMGAVLFFCAEHRHSYPESAESAETKGGVNGATNFLSRLRTAMTGPGIVASKVLFLTINASRWNMYF